MMPNSAPHTPGRLAPGRRAIPVSVLLLVVLGLPAPSAGQQAASSATAQAAEARQRDAESLRELLAESELLYQRDRVKLDGYQYCSQSVALADRGELRESIRAAGKALLVGREDDDRKLQALAMRDLAIAYSYEGNLEQAERYAREALALSGVNMTGENATGVIAPATKVLGDVEARRGRHGHALAAYKQALAMASERYKPLIQLSMVNALVALQRVDEAEEILAQVKDADARGLKPFATRTTGNLRLAQGRPKQALDIFDAGLKRTRGADSAYERLWLMEGVARSKLALDDRAGALQAYREAIQIADSMRAKFRSEEFKTGLFGDSQRIFESAIALAVGGGDYEEALRISERSRARALLDMIRERTSGETAGFAPLAPVEPGLLRAALREDEAVLEYHVLDDQLVLWLISREGVTGATVAVSRAELTRAVEQFRASIINLDGSARKRAQLLHGALVAPAGLAAAQRLIVVPHGPLHYLPFQALFDGTSFLIERHPITVAPSATVVYRSMLGPSSATKGLVAFGNPDLGQSDLALPGAQREVERISGLFSTREVYLQRQATKSRFKDKAGRASVLHVAAHAQVDAVDPIYSRVLLAPEEGNDGRLEAREVFDLDLTGVKLVTLSACESGLGKVMRGDEIIGFTRSFLSAGVSSVVVSLWPVSDESTEILMSTLYGELKRGRSMQDAMQAGQLNVLKQRKFSHPFFWAAFNLIGDWRSTIGS